MLVWCALLQGALLYASPTPAVIALGLWWNSNTVSHNFIHRRFFQSRWANVLFGVYLSLLLGIPQSLWRSLHLAHHAQVRARLAISAELILQIVLILTSWTVLSTQATSFFLWSYIPGYLAGLGLCSIHGYYEHARGATSHYGRLYNLLCFNDGYHAEHHANPALHWTRLPESLAIGAPASRWPAPLRWLEAFSLEALEQLVIRVPLMQRWVLRTHSRAIGRLLRMLPRVERVSIVGGGLYPRTALILERLIPGCHITIIDASRDNLDRARKWLGTRQVELHHARFPEPSARPCDLLVIPLAYEGDRRVLYTDPPAAAVMVHDWIWRRRGAGRIVSLALFKRINLVRPCEPPVC